MGRQTQDIFEHAIELVRHDRYWTKREATVVIGRLIDSGLSVAEFAREHGFPDKRVRRWKQILEASRAIVPTGAPSGQEQDLPIVPVRVVRDGPEIAGGESLSCSIEILVNGDRRVRVPRGFDEETLARVVTVLEGLPC